ncbi:MAG TPA: S8 family serine peptidase [Actinomycetota bacterium]|nr:S8 family serine peptidase [Actinomycetota bacterium]
MKNRSVLAILSVVALVALAPGLSGAKTVATGSPRAERRFETSLKGFVPAVAATSRVTRYFVVMKAPSVADRVRAGTLGGVSERAARASAFDSQRGAIAEARSLGARIVFRYGTLVNAFSATLSPRAAAQLAARSDVASVQPVSIVTLDNSTSVPFIGATEVWDKLGKRGQGMTLALVDTGIDYTHATFGGSGDPADYAGNDPNVVEPGTFPTAKVVGGFDFVGDNYDVLDEDTSNDIPRSDFDPLDRDGHGTHTGGTCCGSGVPGSVGPGVAPETEILAYKVWDAGNSTDDVLVAAYERAVDPNQDGDTRDRADVLSFSGGVAYGTLNSVEAVAAQRVVDVGTVFVASAGNEGNQPVGASAYITGTPGTARGVISVAASIDQFVAQTLSVDTPPTELPDGGIIVHQDWSAELTSDITDLVIDAREFDVPADPENPAPGDAMFCDTVPGADFAGNIALVFKGSTGAGDCDGSAKVFFAQQAGASGVILWNGFGGFPFGLSPGDHAEEITIPAVMLSEADAETLGDTISPDAANSTFNTVDTTVTIHADPSPIPGFEDSMTDFTSEGPARVSNDLKPDISAPGFGITSAAVGTGDGAAVLSGTSMAAPHVSGAAVLLRQIHPKWSPAQIKAVLMNQATRKMSNNDLSKPAPATVIGAGRVEVFGSAVARSVASPGSLSYGLRHATGVTSQVRMFRVKNFDKVAHTYKVSAQDRYFDFDPDMTTLALSLDGTSFSSTKSFNLAPGKSRKVWLRVEIDPSFISEPEQEYGWYYFHPNLDGTVVVKQNAPRKDVLRVAWHVAPLAASDDSLSESSLDLTGGPATLTVDPGAAAGVSFADLYLLGTTDPVGSTGEEDIVAVGARSFTGDTIDGVAEGLPTGQDALVGLSWLEFLTNDDEPTEPVEFVVQGAGVRNTTETLEIDIRVDVGADGVFADEDLQADVLIVKPPGPGGFVVVYDLSVADPFENPVAVYFADYSVYNTNVTGLAVDAGTIGLSDATPTLAYHVTSCTGRFSGDVPGEFCDTAGELDEGTGTYSLLLNAIDPSLQIDPLVCGGFFDGGACDALEPITVSTGSAGPEDDPSILAVFPNNAPSRTPTVVTTDT